MTKPIGQHVIPRMYLENWVGTDPPGQVWTYFKNTSHRKSGSPEKTAKIRHFYTIRSEDDEPNWQTEDFLGSIESNAKEPLKEFAISGYIRGTKERESIAAFVASMVFRTTSMREAHAQRYAWEHQEQMREIASSDREFQALVSRLEESDGKELTEAEVKELRSDMLNTNRYKFYMRKEIPVEMMCRSIESVTPDIARMNWATVHSKGQPFITCDNPVLQYAPPEAGALSFKNPEISFTIPLNPHCVMMMSWQEFHHHQLVMPPETVAQENDLRIIQARNEIYAREKNEALSTQISALKDTRPFIDPMPGELSSEYLVMKGLQKEIFKG